MTQREPFHPRAARESIDDLALQLAAPGNKHLGTKHLPGLINQKPETADREDGTKSCARPSLATSVGTVPQ